MKTKTKKLNANQRALLAGCINATLRKLDGRVPRRLRLDYETMRVVQLVPIENSDDAGIVNVMDVVKPMLRALRKS